MSKKGNLPNIALLAAVLMVFQYAVMPLFHAHAHGSEATHHGKAPSEENCAFAKVAGAPVVFEGVQAVHLCAPVLGPTEPTAPSPGLLGASLVPDSSRGPPFAA